MLILYKMELISHLKKEHVELFRLFDLADFIVLKESLLAHLDLENKLLYPAFSHSADKEIKQIGKKFSNEMMKILPIALEFFEKYSNKSIQDLNKNKTFKADFSNIIKVVKKRIKIEEEILFPRYKKLKEKNKGNQH